MPLRYDWVGRFSEGRAAVRVGGLYGFIDEDGREPSSPSAAPSKYESITAIAPDRFLVLDGKSGLIDRDGKMVIPPHVATGT